MKFTTKIDSTNDRKSYRNFKGVNNINLLESDDEEDNFNPDERIYGKESSFKTLPQSMEDKGL